MPMIDRRHLLTKDCSLMEVAFVTLDVSDPHRRTDFTLVLNIRSLVFPEIVLNFHTGRYEQKTCHFCLKSLFYIFRKYLFYFLKTKGSLRCKVDEIPFRKAAAVHNTSRGDLDTCLCGKVACSDLTSIFFLSILAHKSLDRGLTLVGKLFLNFADEIRQHKHSLNVKISP